MEIDEDGVIKTYVHEGQEVMLTGRRAKKKGRRTGKTDEVVEIKPTGQMAASFFKWVRMADLYQIIEDKSHE